MTALDADDVRAAVLVIQNRLSFRAVLGHWDLLSLSPYEAAQMAVEALQREGFSIARNDGPGCAT